MNETYDDVNPASYSNSRDADPLHPKVIECPEYLEFVIRTA